MKNVLKALLLIFVVGAFFSACQKDTVFETTEGITLKEMAESNIESTPVSEGGITPYIIKGVNKGGNRTCAEAAEAFGIDSFEYSSGRINTEGGEFQGQFPDGFEVTLDDDGIYLLWKFTPPTGYCIKNMAVIVKGSAQANVYFYDGGQTTDFGLAAPSGSFGLSNLTFCYNLEPCDTECEGETAFGGDTKYNFDEGRAWWSAFKVSDGSPQKIYAGKKEVPGASVSYEDGKIIISLGDYMELKDGNETVKIQGYDELPTSRPVAGHFAYKGMDLIVDVDEYPFYVIHLDVEVCWPEE